MVERENIPDAEWHPQGEFLHKAFSIEMVESVARGAWAEQIHFAHMDMLASPDVEFFFTLCPLYSPGRIEESRLLGAPNLIAESRVVNKWNAIHSIVTAEAHYFQALGGEVQLTAVFANRGVLLQGKPETDDAEALAYEASVYGEEFGQLCSQLNVNGALHTYDQLGVQFPTFVEPSMPAPDYGLERSGKDSNRLIETVNTFMRESGNVGNIFNNRKNRKKVERIMDAWGFDTAFWLLTGYLAFDPMIPQFIQENGIYMVTERFDPLFSISSFTPALANQPRMDIKA